MKTKLTIAFLTIGILAIGCIYLFMFTATSSSPTNMTLYMPKDSEKSVEKYSHVKTKLTLILLDDEKVFTYFGNFIQDGKTVSINETDKLIDEGWKMFPKDSLVVVIKPTKSATYKLSVDMLDKMVVKNVKKYTMTDLNKQEKEFLKIAE